MQKYPVRTTHRAGLSPDALVAVARDAFGTAEVDGPSVTVRFGAIVALRASAEGKELKIEVTMDPKVPEAVAQDTIHRYNRFLEAATGYTSKERAKRLRKSAGG